MAEFRLWPHPADLCQPVTPAAGSRPGRGGPPHPDLFHDPELLKCGVDVTGLLLSHAVFMARWKAWRSGSVRPSEVVRGYDSRHTAITLLDVGPPLPGCFGAGTCERRLTSHEAPFLTRIGQMECLSPGPDGVRRRLTPLTPVGRVHMTG